MDLGEQLKTFSKDSIRLVKRCTKPDAKGRLNMEAISNVKRKEERKKERKRRENRETIDVFD